MYHSGYRSDYPTQPPQYQPPPAQYQTTPSLHLQISSVPPPHRYPAADMSQLSQNQPPSPTERDSRSEEEMPTVPAPPPASHVWQDKIWALEVRQHPMRARMCGFGDKDRRPISPPPCIRLIVLDRHTKKEVEYENFDLNSIVLIADIFTFDGTKEMNLVKASHASPCISSAAAGPFPTQPPQPPPASGYRAPEPFPTAYIPGFNREAQHPQSQPPHSPASGYHPHQSGQAYTPNSQYSAGGFSAVNGQHNGAAQFRPSGPPDPYAPRYNSQYPPASSFPHPPPSPMPSYGEPYPGGNPSEARTEHFTRNLIGSTCASAFKLKDENDKMGIWFVLQDLSVRTEGWFRLRMMLFNLQEVLETQIKDEHSSQSNGTVPSTGHAPCLASVFSNPFRVYSAKKFPGVVESTTLSKAFANQGIKIPIRKDTGGKRKGGGSDDEDEDDS